MFKKFSSSLQRKPGQKFRFDLQIVQLENLPAPVKKCRIIWSRGAKVQYTEMKDVKNGTALYKQTLSQVATLYSDKDKFEAKEYNFKVQVPGKGGDEKMLTIGKASVDMARYATLDSTPQNAMIPISFKVGQSSTGYLKLVITSQILKGVVVDDGMTDMSGVTGMTSTNASEEQDLSGFDETQAGKVARSSSKSKVVAPLNSSSSPSPSSPAAPSKPVAPVPSKTTSRAAPIAAATLATTPEENKDDDDISPMNSDIENFFWTQEEGQAAPEPKVTQASPSMVARAAPSVLTTSRSKKEELVQTPKTRAPPTTSAAVDVAAVSLAAENERLKSQLAALQERVEAADQEALLLHQYQQRIQVLEDQLAEALLPEEHDALVAKHARELAEMELKVKQANDDAEKRIAQAYKTADESLLAATASERAKTALVMEVETLKAQLEELQALGYTASADHDSTELERDVTTKASAMESVDGAYNEGYARELDALRAQIASLQQSNDELKDQVMYSAGMETMQPQYMEEKAQLEHELEQARATIQELTAAKLQLESQSIGNEKVADLMVELEQAQAMIQELSAARPQKDSLEYDHNTDLELELQQAQATIQELTTANLEFETYCQAYEARATAEKAALEAQLAESSQRHAELEAHAAELEAHNNELEFHAAQIAADLLALQTAQTAAQATRELSKEALVEVPKITSDSDLDSDQDAQEAIEFLKQQIAVLEDERATLQDENIALVRQLEAEHEEKEQLQEQLKRNLEDVGDEMAVETVAAFEVKYSRLKDRYQELELASREELDTMKERVREANDEVSRLQKQLLAVEIVRDKALKEAKVLEDNAQRNAKASTELDEIRRENETMMHELVHCKLELAQLHEKEIICRRELYKAKETSMKLASKATKLETLLYTNNKK